MSDLVVIGGGGFGRETLDTIEAAVRAGADLRVRGVVDRDPSEVTVERLRRRRVTLLGPDWRRHLDARFIVAVGHPGTRSAVVAELAASGARFATVVHPNASVGTRVSLGEGAVVCARAVLSTEVVIGDHVHVNPNATIGHDAVIGACSSVNPGAIISGEVQIGERVLIGAGAVVLQGLAVGADAVVGAAACVVRPVPPRTIVKGVPARSNEEEA